MLHHFQTQNSIHVRADRQTHAHTQSHKQTYFQILMVLILEPLGRSTDKVKGSCEWGGPRIRGSWLGFHRPVKTSSAQSKSSEKTAPCHSHSLFPLTELFTLTELLLSILHFHLFFHFYLSFHCQWCTFILLNQSNSFIIRVMFSMICLIVRVI